LKLKFFLYPGGPKIEDIQLKLETLHPPLSEPIKKQTHIFALQILDRINNITEMSNPNNFTQNQTITDQNHVIVLQGRMNPPSFWEKTLSKISG
jgi:hypothetical protein